MTRPLLTNVQFLRFLAAVAVLVGHAGDLFMPAAAHLRTIPWSAGVDIFFVISGFVMTYLTQGQFGRPGAPRAFLIRRIIRIVPPYWLFTTLMVVAVLLFSDHIRNTELDGASVITSYLFVPWPRVADGQLNPLLSQGWTLNYEAFFYLAFAAALFFRRGLVWLAGGFLLLAALHPLVPAHLFVLKFWTNPIILEFLGGAGLAVLFLRGLRLSAVGLARPCSARGRHIRCDRADGCGRFPAARPHRPPRADAVRQPRAGAGTAFVRCFAPSDGGRRGQQLHALSVPHLHAQRGPHRLASVRAGYAGPGDDRWRWSPQLRRRPSSIAGSSGR